MAVSLATYQLLPYFMVTGQLDYTDTVFKVMLASNAYPLNLAQDYSVDQVIPYEVTGPGYVAGGVDLDAAWTVGIGSGAVKLIPSGTAVWSNATFTARFAVIHGNGGFLFAVVDFGVNQSVVNDEFAMQWTQDGVAVFR